MKKLIILFLILNLSLGFSQKKDLQLAIRNIKLGNTYREGKEYDKSAGFISDGLNIAKKFNSFEGKYWTAVAYESLGYLYRDMSMFDESKKNFTSALDIYKKIIKQEDGSQFAMIEVLNNIANINSSNINLPEIGGINLSNSVVLSSMKLKELPNDLPKNLKNLILKDNRFRQFPDALINFQQLEYLDLSENRIREISPMLGNLTSLHYLDLSNNKIDKIPSSISNLQNLKELNLEGNKLKTINFNFCNLKNLKILNLRNNKLNFQEVLKLVKCLPNTNIIFDKYEKSEDNTDETEN